MDLLPSRPLRLDSNLSGKDRRKPWPLCIIALVMAFGAFAFAAAVGKDLSAERALWARGVAGEVTNISGEATETRNSLLFDYSYDLNVTYLDAAGAHHSGKAKFTYMFSKLDENAPVELRYDPSSPDRFVLNWQAAGGVPRWGMFILLSIVGLALFSIAPLTMRKSRKLNSLLETVAQDGEELWLEVVKLGHVNGAPFIHYLVPSGDGKGETKKKQMLPVAPLIVSRDGKEFAIALRSPREPKQLYFVPDDLGPFAFTAEERQTIARTLASHRTN
jgi:hypothetical protein